ncbi:MAG: DNA gyrase inhibitor YacG [Candidatus Binatia bacterium]
MGMPTRIKCPTCRAEVQWESNPHRPFCSERCQLIDLGAWTSERYRIPGHKWQGDPERDDDDEDGDEKVR